MLQVLKTAGNQPLSGITGSAIKQGVDRRKPYAARHFVDTLHGMYKWAVAAEHVRIDPTAGNETVPFHSYWLLAVAALLWRVRKGYKGIKLQKSSDERI